ncbi:hypothetical protein SEA_WATERT_62 [Microbacterium phage WaterT]|nr:hypothetical protein SEA_WATERT_62 [Microbacterium phage WaterT]
MSEWQEDEISDLKSELSEADRSRVAVKRYVHTKMSRIRLGIYSEERDGTLLEVLEEIEGMIR